MEDIDLADQARQLREDGYSVKKIARALGISPATAADLVNAAAAAQPDIADDAVVGCWLSPGWSSRLTLDDPGRWPDVAVGSSEPSGLANVLLARPASSRQVRVSGFLLDLYCLGVKSVIGPMVFDEGDLPEFKDQFFTAYSAPPLAVPLELAQQLVHGAVAYARELGFKPASGFKAAAAHLGTATGPSGISYGRDGKPFYIQGPHDDAKAVLRTLDRTVGAGNYNYMADVLVR